MEYCRAENTLTIKMASDCSAYIFCSELNFFKTHTHIVCNWSSQGGTCSLYASDPHCIPAVHKWPPLRTRQLACLCVFHYIKIIACFILWIIHCCCTAVEQSHMVTQAEQFATLYLSPRLVLVREGSGSLICVQRGLPQLAICRSGEHS